MTTIRMQVWPIDGGPYEQTLDWEDLLAGLQELVGGYIEIVRSELLDARFGTFENDGRIVMVVNEEGLIHGLPRNHRASSYYPGPTGICGTAVLLAEATVYDDGYPDRDFVSLPGGVSIGSEA